MEKRSHIIHSYTPLVTVQHKFLNKHPSYTSIIQFPSSLNPKIGFQTELTRRPQSVGSKELPIYRPPGVHPDIVAFNVVTTV